MARFDPSNDLGGAVNTRSFRSSLRASGRLWLLFSHHISRNTPAQQTQEFYASDARFSRSFEREAGVIYNVTICPTRDFAGRFVVRQPHQIAIRSTSSSV